MFKKYRIVVSGSSPLLTKFWLQVYNLGCKNDDVLALLATLPTSTKIKE